MATTVKVVCTEKSENTEGVISLSFSANYADEKGNPINQDWAYATPHCGIRMTVNATAGENFEKDKTYTLTFKED